MYTNVHTQYTVSLVNKVSRISFEADINIVNVNIGVIVSINNTASIITLALPKFDNNNNNNI